MGVHLLYFVVVVVVVVVVAVLLFCVGTVSATRSLLQRTPTECVCVLHACLSNFM